MNSSCKKRLLIALRKAPLWTINHYFFLHSKCGNAWINVAIKNLIPIKGTRSSFVLPPNFMSGSLQNTLSGTPAVALIPYLYNGSSRAASSFSMPGSEAIFHGFVCTRFHLPELSLPASFMYSSLHCLYEVEANIHPQRICVKSFLFKMGERCEAGIRI